MAERRNTVPINAILPNALVKAVKAMNDEYYNRILSYKSAMAQVVRMLNLGIITSEEHAIIDTMIAQKYGLSLCSIFRDNDLINSCNRGNISHYKEVI